MKKPIATVEVHCGRTCLMVAGLVLAVEMDVCRECEYRNNQWTIADLKDAADRINRVRNT